MAARYKYLSDACAQHGMTVEQYLTTLPPPHKGPPDQTGRVMNVRRATKEEAQ